MGTMADHYASPSEHDPRKYMAYVIAEPCIGTKDNSCVEVCPVDCIHPTPDEPDYDKVEMLYIDPEECIDCDACVEACPVDACFAEDQLPDEWQRYAQINSEYFTSSVGRSGRPRGARGAARRLLPHRGKGALAPEARRPEPRRRWREPTLSPGEHADRADGDQVTRARR